MTLVRFSLRALSDLDTIDCNSVQTWGQRIADRYLADLETALHRLAEDVSLFRASPERPGRLRFYPVREHVIIGDVIDGTCLVLTVRSDSQDSLDQLSKLEPDLLLEAELMARQIEFPDA